MTLTWLEAIGYCGTLATFVSYSMRTIVPLRIASILSSVFFITYASISGLWPILATELMLLPLNVFRLAQDWRAPVVVVQARPIGGGATGGIEDRGGASQST